MTDSLISIIVPVYNVEKYLRKCVDSVLKQTYKNIEILLIDDGSTDESGSICDSYGSKDDRVRVFHKQNGGLSDARNYGIDRSNGSYIGFVDADDFIHPQMYEVLYSALVGNDADIAACSFWRDGEEEFNTASFCVKHVGIKRIPPVAAINDPFSIYVMAWNKLYRSDLFQTIRYPINRLCEDEFIYHKILHKCKKVVFIEAALYFYVNRPNAIMSRVTRKRVLDARTALRGRIHYAENKWIPAISGSVNSYCKFCIDYYMYLNNQITDNNSRLAAMLLGDERKVVRRYKKYNIKPIYRLIAINPELGLKVIECQPRVESVKSIIKSILKSTLLFGNRQYEINESNNII